MQIKSFVPQNHLLRNYIECFYALMRRADEKDDFYIAFPNVIAILCLNKQTKIELIENVRTLSFCPENEIESNLICHFSRAEQIRYRGKTDEICINFKSLGINAFLNQELIYYVQSAFAEFNPFADYRVKMAEIFSLANSEQRIRALEHYWLSKLVGFRHPFLPQIVGEIMKNDCPFSLSEAARENRNIAHDARQAF